MTTPIDRMIDTCGLTCVCCGLPASFRCPCWEKQNPHCERCGKCTLHCVCKRPSIDGNTAEFAPGDYARLRTELFQSYPEGALVKVVGRQWAKVGWRYDVQGMGPVRDVPEMTLGRVER